jgi:hypothetical protein
MTKEIINKVWQMGNEMGGEEHTKKKVMNACTSQYHKQA